MAQHIFYENHVKYYFYIYLVPLKYYTDVHPYDHIQLLI